jgi:hypothetical protein
MIQTKTRTLMTTTLTDAENMGAPTQDEIADYQVRAGAAQMATIVAASKVADAREALAYASAEEAASQATVAKLNVEGAQLQQRVQFSREASASSRLLVPQQANQRVRG